jgi:hypothetical protein
MGKFIKASASKSFELATYAGTGAMGTDLSATLSSIANETPRMGRR